jgi:hypothetical protein
MAGLRDVVDALEHQGGDGEEGGIVEVVLGRVPTSASRQPHTDSSWEVGRSGVLTVARR